MIITKGIGDYRGIGLVEVIWEVCVSIMNNRLQAGIALHDVLYVFGQGRGTGRATMEAKLARQLAGLLHEPTFQVSLDVRKAYDCRYTWNPPSFHSVPRSHGLNACGISTSSPRSPTNHHRS